MQPKAPYRQLGIALAISLLASAGSASAMSFTFSRIAGTEDGYSNFTVPGFVLGTIRFRANPPGSTGQASLAGSAGGGVTAASGGGGGGAYRSTDASTGQTGIFTDVGGTVATIVPYDSRFSALGEPDDNDGTVAYQGTDANGEGIYRNDNNNTPAENETTVANQDTPADPSSGDTLNDFGDPVTDDGDVAFQATSDNGDQGIYIADADGKLTELVDTNTEVPDTTGTVTFDSLSDPSLDNDEVAFTATTSDGDSGLYVAGSDTAGTVNIEKVIEINDPLDNKTLSSLVLSEDAVDNGSLTFLAGFTDDSEGIYRATPINDPILLPQGAPTPATAALLFAGLGLLGFTRRHSNTRT